MAAKNSLIDEVSEFLASGPTRDELLAYRPSPRVQTHITELLAKAKTGALSSDEEWELDQFEHLEMLLQAVKARLRVKRVIASS